MLAWHLDNGAYLEDVDVLLSWGASFDDLADGAMAPEVLRQPRSIHLTWRNHRMFDALQGDLHACRILEAPNPRAFHIYLPELHWFSFELATWEEDPRAAQHQLRRLHDHIAAALGPATFSYPEYSRGLPSIFWERGSVQLALGPLHGSTRLEIDVQHEPSGYLDLRDAAARIREEEGPGRRVDHVAWNPDL